jgi:hypothetical protein
MNYKKIIISLIVMSLFCSLGSIQIQKAEDTIVLNNEIEDVGIGHSSSIQGGDVVSTGENEILKRLFNAGDKPSEIDFQCLIDKFDGNNWEEVDSEIKGPYDLDPDAWVESFFDVSFDVEGEYRATFSLLTPITHEPWSDDNPENDKHQVVFSVRQHAGVKDVYVDDDADPGGDGTRSAPFQTITDALDQAVEGVCIWVAPGEYQENLRIDTPRVTIRPDYGKCDCDNPALLRCVIDGGGIGDVMKITADWVIISGLTLQDCGTNEEDAALNVTSNHNLIRWNRIEDNGATGIYLHDAAQYNYIHHNIIQNNGGAGLFIWENSIHNWMYHNDFIQNTWYNVKDKEAGNIWYHNEVSGGNYWDDYSGSDTNGDGIGDTPYEIRGDTVQTGVDSYPWMIPHGWNNQPKVPMIDGITSGIPGKSYTYNFTIGDEHFEPGSEPFEEHVYCWVDWGDGGKEAFGPVYLSNIADNVITMEHQWQTDGSYVIQAKLIDAYGEESDWGTLPVSMPKTKVFINPILRFLENHPRLFPLLQLFITSSNIC